MSSPMAECSKRMRALRREIRDGSDLEGASPVPQPCPPSPRTHSPPLPYPPLASHLPAGKFTLDETKEARDKLKEEGAFDEEIIKKCFKGA